MGQGSLLPCHVVPGYRKIEGESGSFSFHALDIDISVMVLDGAPDDRQAQPSSASPHDFPGVEGFENAFEVVSRDAFSRV